MLRTNSKAARENIRAYIMEHYDPSGYDVEQAGETWPEIAANILDVFRAEKYYSLEYMQVACLSEIKVFCEWAAGLPSILDTCYFYNRSAVEDLGAILEETEAEKARYSESDAEQLLTRLIYNELLKGVKENAK